MYGEGREGEQGKAQWPTTPNNTRAQTLMENIQFTSRKGSWRPRQCKAAVMRALLVMGRPIKEPSTLSTAMLKSKNTSCCAAPSAFSKAVPGMGGTHGFWGGGGGG